MQLVVEVGVETFLCGCD